MHVTYTDKQGHEVTSRKPERELRIDVANLLYEVLRSKGRGLFVDQNGRFLYHNPRNHRLANVDGREFNERLLAWGMPKCDSRSAIVDNLKDMGICPSEGAHNGIPDISLRC